MQKPLNIQDFEKHTISIDGFEDEGHDSGDNIICERNWFGLCFGTHLGHLFNISKQYSIGISTQTLLSEQFLLLPRLEPYCFQDSPTLYHKINNNRHNNKDVNDIHFCELQILVFQEKWS